MAQNVGSAKVELEVDASGFGDDLIKAAQSAMDKLGQIMQSGFSKAGDSAEQSMSGTTRALDDAAEAATRAAEAGAKVGADVSDGAKQAEGAATSTAKALDDAAEAAGRAAEAGSKVGTGVADGAKQAEGAASSTAKALDAAADAAGRMGESGAQAGAQTARGSDQVASSATAAQRAMDAAANAAKNMGSQGSSAARAVESAELKLSATRSKAVRDVVAAEEALTRARASGNTDAIASAEAKLGEVRARSTASVIDAENRLSAARSKAASEAQNAGAQAASGMDKAAGAAGAAATSMGRVEAAAAGAGQAASEAGAQAASGMNKGEAAASKLFSTLGKIAAIAAPVAGIGAIISSGFKRGNDLERADIIFQNIGLSAGETEQQLAKLSDQVTGTSLSLSDAAKYSAAFAQSGVEMGKPMDDAVKALTNISAAAQGTGTDVGIVMQQISSAGKLMGGDAMQLQQAGVNIYKYVSDYMGLTIEEVKKLGEEGKITFEDVVNSINMGMGDLAKELGQTLPAKFANFKTALASLGHAGTEAFRPLLADALTFGTTLLKDVTPRVREISEAIAEAISKGEGWSKIFDGASMTTAINATKNVFQTLGVTMQNVWKIAGELGSAIAKASAMIGINTWTLFVTALEAVLKVFNAVAPAITQVAELLNRYPQILAAVMAGWLAFKTIPAIMKAASVATTALQTRIAAMGQQATVAQVQMGRFGSAIAGIGKGVPVVAAMQKSFVTASTGASRFGRAAGVAAASMTGLKLGAGALVSALGGPLGIALGAATIGIMGVVTSSQKMDAAQEQLKSSSDNLSEAQQSMWQNIGDAAAVSESVVVQLQAMREEMEAQANAGMSGWDAFVVDLKNFDLFADESPGMQMKRDANNMKEAAQNAQSALDELGMSNEEMAQAVRGSSDEWLALVSRLQDLGPNGVAAIEYLGQLRDEFMRMSELEAKVGTPFMELQGALDQVGDSANNADAALDGMRRTMEILGFIQTSATDQLGNVSEAVDKAAASFGQATFAADQFGASFMNEDGSLNLMNQGARELNDSLSAMTDELMAVALQGGDVNGIWDQMGPKLDSMRTAAEAAGVDFDKLLDSIGLAPKDIEFMIQLAGADQVQRDVLAVSGELSKVPPKTETTVWVHSEDALSRLREAGVEIHDWKWENGQIVADVSVEDQGVVDSLAEVAGNIDLWKEEHGGGVEVPINGSTAGFDSSKSWVDTQMGVLDGSVATSTLDGDPTQFFMGMGDVEGGLNTLNGKSSNSAMNGDPSGAQTAAAQATDAVNGVPDDHSTDIKAIDLASSIALGVLDTVLAIPLSRTITFSAKKIGDWLGIGGGYTGGKFNGASFSRYAKGGRHPGYRLPEAGPGTDKRDGFTAWDVLGQPAALLDAGEWVINGQSSRKYDRELAAINAGVFPKLPGFARGGGIGVDERVDDMQPIVISGEQIAAALLSGMAPLLKNAQQNMTAQTNTAAGAAQSAAPAVQSASGPAGGELSSEGGSPADALADAADAMTGTAEGVLAPMWQQQTDAVSMFGQTVSDTANSVVTPTFTTMASNLATSASSVINPTLSAVQQGTIATGAQFVNQAQSVITPTWQNMGANILGVKTGTIDPVFAGVQGGLQNTAGAFATNTSNMISEWSRLREGAAAPVRFVIGTVFNEGLVGMWNSVSDMLDTKKMAPYPLRFATGGHVQGPGGPTEDKIPALLSDGEYVMTADAVNRLGVKNLNALNYSSANAVDGSLASSRDVQMMLKDYTAANRYAGGGIVKGDPTWNRFKRAHDFARKWDGSPYVWGGSLGPNGGTDCSGYMSSIADVIHGGSGLMRQWATGAFPGGGGAQGASGPQGFVQGLGGGMSIGVSTVHTAGTLGGIPGLPTVNVESGGGHGRVAYGGPATGADDSQFPSQYHLAMAGLGRFVSGGGGGASIFSIVDSLVNEKWEPVQAKVEAANFPGLVGQELPGAAAGKLKEAFDNKVGKLMEEMGGDPGGSGAERWRPMMIRALRAQGLGHWADNPAIVDRFIRQIQTESGGDPGIAQQIVDVNGTGESAGVGLGQMIPTTWAANRDPNLPDDRRNPWAMTNAMARYVRNRYGENGYMSIGNGIGYDSGGILPPTPGGFGTYYNHTGGPEYVLTKSQWRDIAGTAVGVAQLVDPLRVIARDMRDLPVTMRRMPTAIAERLSQSPVGVALLKATGDAASAVDAAIPAPVRQAISEVDRAGRTWGYVSNKLNEKAWAWARGQWPIDGDIEPTVEATVTVDGKEVVVEAAEAAAEVVDKRADWVGWKQPSLDESLVNMTGWNLLAAQKVANQEMKPGNDPVSRTIYDVFGRAPIIPELARIYSRGDRYTFDAIDAAFETIETGNTEALSKFTHETSQLTQAVLAFRRVAIDTGRAVKGAVDVVDRAQVSAQAWIRGDWVQIDKDKRLATPGEMLDQTLGNMFAETANEAGGYVGLGNMVTAPKIVDETGLVVLPKEYLDALKEQANPEMAETSSTDLLDGAREGEELADELADATETADKVLADTTIGDSGDAAKVTASTTASGDDSQRPIQIDVTVNVNGSGDPAAVARAVEDKMKHGLESAIGGTVRSL